MTHVSRFAVAQLTVAAAVLLILSAIGANVAQGQGVLVNIEPGVHVRLPRPIIIVPPHPRPLPPPPPASYKIKELDVQATLVEQVAKVQVSQSFVNTGSRPLEVAFIFPLPYDGAIDRLTLLVDGKEIAARLLPKDEARRIYEQIVRKNRDPALLEWMGTGMFQTSVFPVPPGAERKVSLRYTQLCRKDQGLTDFLFPLSTAKYTSHAIEKINIRLNIDSSVDIKNVYSPTHTVEVKREGRHATVTYASQNSVPTSDFRLFYDVEAGKVGASVLSYRPTTDHDGYFLLLASPQIKGGGEHPAKTVLFVLDRSGSMSGKKIEQAKGALKFVLNNLREGDLFNIITYDSDVQSFRSELQRFSEQTRGEALGYVEGIYAGGSTNINGALTAALKQLVDSQRPNYMLFLTDGLPTAGETNEMKIVANAKSANQVRARVVAFGVGYDLNSRLLDKLVRENFGQSEYVRPDEDIEARVSRLFSRIESPVLTDVSIRFSVDSLRPEDGQPVNRVYPKDVFDLFAGEQLVLVGRYKKPGTAKVVVTGKVGSEQQSFDFPAELAGQSSDETNAFIEKLWAIRRVGEIIDEMDLKGKNDELVKELVELATRHGIMTPYTSFLADETTKLGDVAGNAGEANVRLHSLAQSGGQFGFSQRRAKGELQRADNAAATAPTAAGTGGGRYAGAVYRDAADKVVVVESVRNIGAKCFYKRGEQWVDSTVSDELAKNARHVKQFSDDYFRLAEKHGKDLSQYLALDEPVLVNLAGEVCLIEPAGE
jgi:Ca-activated chloride channel homolog